MLSSVGSFGSGVAHALRGARMLLGTPRLWPLVIIPFVLTLVAFIAMMSGAFALRDRWLDLLPSWPALRAVLGVIAYLALLLVAYFTFLPIASLIAAPFNEAISESIEKIETGREPPPFSLARLVRDLGMALAHELRKLLRYVVLALGVLLASLIPVVGPIVGLVGGGYVAARFAAYDALDATLSRWGWPFHKKTGLIRERRAACLGLGAVVAGMLVVPFVNALAMPVGAAGGTLLALALVPETQRVTDPRVSGERR
jgi:CysZ protein